MIEHDLMTDLERLHAAGAWRGMVLQRRAGAERTLDDLSRSELRRVALALRATSTGECVMIHTRACRRRSDRCRCGGARLVAGARA